ncbi:MAG: hypothetical protein AB7I38_00310 [Dehalococcoidia bacterium]
MTQDDFIADPTDHVIAIVDDPDRAAAAERDLNDSGIDGVHVYRGADGGDSIDASGAEHGVTGGVIRGLQQLFSNKDNMAEYEDAAREGSTVLAVPASDADARDQVTDILRRNGARAINHFGKAVVRTIEP